jgi:hypothetical protein
MLVRNVGTFNDSRARPLTTRNIIQDLNFHCQFSRSPYDHLLRYFPFVEVYIGI